MMAILGFAPLFVTLLCFTLIPCVHGMELTVPDHNVDDVKPPSVEEELQKLLNTAIQTRRDLQHNVCTFFLSQVCIKR